MDAIDEILTDHLAKAADAADLTPPDIDDVRASAARDRRGRRLRNGLLVAACTLVAAGAASILGRDDGSRVDTADEPATTIAPTTTAPPPTTGSTTPTTTSPPTTVPPPTTEPAEPSVPRPPVVEGLGLRADGLGEVDFGTPLAAAVAAVTAQMGAPIDPGRPIEMHAPCLDDDDPAALVSQIVRWEGLDLSFTGADADSLRLAGWHAVELNDGTPTLRMADGPAMDEPASTVWKAAYGDAIEVSAPSTPSSDLEFYWVRLNLPEGLIQGIEATDDERRVLTLSAGADCDGGR